jgi:murein DD-endopeptidase MepM/ murein hydrolase activator NlpD
LTVNRRLPWGVLCITVLICAACTKHLTTAEDGRIIGGYLPGKSSAAAPTRTPFMPPTRAPGTPVITPTPDTPRTLPTPRLEPDQYQVQAGDTLGTIAQKYSIGLNELINANEIANPDALEVGTILDIPAPTPQSTGSDFKIIPDSELVNGPYSAGLDLHSLLTQRDSYLLRYSEDVDGETLSGEQIIARVSTDYSVNPRLLLAVLEERSGWVTRANPDESTRDFPIGIRDSWRQGLYHQLAWAADQLNRGFYLWQINALSTWLLADGSVVPIASTINAGTAGVQNMYALLHDRSGWDQAVGENGLFAVYQELFGYPFDYTYEPLLPSDLSQPYMQLPFESGAVWSFTGGPHGGWGEGSAWAAVDFAPPGEALGCVDSSAWVVAATDGLIVRSDHGAVVQDLDGDGYAQTGWSVLYMHIATTDRVAVGTYVRAGERIGHPSCEGGVSTGTHVHLARRYNGVWISADGALPFVMDGWTSRGDGVEYDGYFDKDGQTIEAWNGRQPENQIQR